MKKLFLFSAVLLMAAGTLTSCKKDYTCTCTFTAPTPTIAVPIEKATKTDATDVCNQAQTTYRIADAAASCTLK